MFKLGDVVKWKSQANASWLRKTGTITEVVAPGSLPSRERFKTLYTSGGVGSTRNHESYVVILFAGKRGATLKTYWPRVSALKMKEDHDG